MYMKSYTISYHPSTRESLTRVSRAKARKEKQKEDIRFAVELLVKGALGCFAFFGSIYAILVIGVIIAG